MKIHVEAESIEELVVLLKRLIDAGAAATTGDGRHISELDLSVRAINVLRSSGVETVAQLVRYSGEELMRMPDMGKKLLAQVRAALAGVGLCLRGDRMGDGS